MTYALAASAATEPDPLLNQVTRVYLLSMSGGLDQFLANQITSKHLFEVVTDPKLADAVMTESIGPAFEAHLNELLPPPAPPEAAPVVKPKKGENEAVGLIGGAVTPRTSSFGRARGNIFLVDLKTRRVVWSTFRLPKSRTPDDLDKTSAQVTNDLMRVLEKK